MFLTRNGLKSLTYRNTLRYSFKILSANKSTKSPTDSANDSNISNQFKHEKRGNFTQTSPVLKNPYRNDKFLQSFAKRHFPDCYFEEIEADFIRLGDDIANEINDLGRECELNPPTLTQYDSWGNRIDRVNTCHAWKQMKSISAVEGVVGHGYKRKYNEHSRLYQMMKLYLFAPSSGLYSCPLAMVDGAAKVLETALKETQDNSLENAFNKLTSLDPNEFWTSGQWMTEIEGGSDVANATATIAVGQSDGSYKLNGYKWFTSATDADMALTLARIVDENGNVIPGTKGISLFYVETRDKSNKVSGLNGLQMVRLKDKLGTRQLPTAEMVLDGTKAQLIGKPGKGIKLISGMLTLTRIHNSIMSAAPMRRILLLAKDYATKRKAFGQLLIDHPLHLQTLARIDVESRAATLLTFETALLLGKTETDTATKEEADLLRLLTPVCKLYTAKQSIAMISEGLESFGAAGYLEDSGLPVLLRDAQVLSIWEGTTNILSLDTLRAVAKSKGEVLNSFFMEINKRSAKVSDLKIKELRNSTAKVQIAAGDLRAFISQTSKMDPQSMFLSARDFSYSLARIYCGMLMVEHAAWTNVKSDIHGAAIWCNQDLCPVTTNLRIGTYNEKATTMDKELLD